MVFDGILDGYGSKLLNLLRWKTQNTEFPLTLGLEFYGVVKGKGHGVGNHIHLDDKVYGVTLPQRGGCHAEYIVVDQLLVGRLIRLVEANDLQFFVQFFSCDTNPTNYQILKRVDYCTLV